MRPLTLQEMAAAIGARVLGQITEPRVTSVSTDSRTAKSGALFVAIEGATYDGHDFVEDALAKGATAAVISRSNRLAEDRRADGRLIVVEDTVAALGRLASWYRRQFAAPVIAVVGSNGKTTTKDLIATVLGSTMPGHAAPASFNNAIGVPLTLLSVEPAHQFVVVEIGTNHPGEVAALARIARPDLAVVTSIGEEHLAFFGDVEAVAKEEFSFLGALQDRALVAVSDQAARYAPKRLLAGRPSDESRPNLLVYGFDEAADLRATGVRHTESGLSFQVNGRFDYEIPLTGKHNALNALAAIAIGTRFRLGHDRIAAALRGFDGPPMRMQRQSIGSITVINDAYNANPSSVRAALQALDDFKSVGRRVLILGDMKELGDSATRCHREVGMEAGRSTAAAIIATGAHARVIADGATMTAGTRKRIYSYPTVEALAERLPKLLAQGDIVLLKASRGVRMERLLPVIEAHAGKLRRSDKAS